MIRGGLPVRPTNALGSYSAACGLQALMETVAAPDLTHGVDSSNEEKWRR